MSANDPEFDSLYRILLSEVYLQLAGEAPETVAEPIQRRQERAVVAPPSTYLNAEVDGRETSYFEWLGAGLYSADRCSGTRLGPPYSLHELHYGFGEQFFYLRVDVFPETFPRLRDSEFRITVCGSEELRLAVLIEEGKLAGCLLDSENVCILGPHELVEVAFDRILEVGIGRRLLPLTGRTSLAIEVELWQGGLPVDFLPAESWLEVKLGAEAFAWPAP